MTKLMYVRLEIFGISTQQALRSNKGNPHHPKFHICNWNLNMSWFPRIRISEMVVVWNIRIPKNWSRKWRPETWKVMNLSHVSSSPRSWWMKWSSNLIWRRTWASWFRNLWPSKELKWTNRSCKSYIVLYVLLVVSEELGPNCIVDTHSHENNLLQVVLFTFCWKKPSWNLMGLFFTDWTQPMFFRWLARNHHLVCYLSGLFPNTSISSPKIFHTFLCLTSIPFRPKRESP